MDLFDEEFRFMPTIAHAERSLAGKTVGVDSTMALDESGQLPINPR